MRNQLKADLVMDDEDFEITTDDYIPTPVGCEAYCACPACFGPGYDEWVMKGSPTLCTDGKVHLMSFPGKPVVGE